VGLIAHSTSERDFDEWIVCRQHETLCQCDSSAANVNAQAEAEVMLEYPHEVALAQAYEARQLLVWIRCERLLSM